MTNPAESREPRADRKISYRALGGIVALTAVAAVEIAALLTYAAVDDSRNLPDRFVLRYRDPDRSVLAKGGFAIGTPVRLSVQTSDPGGPVPLLRGEVTALECELDATGTFTEIRGLDLAHRLLRGRRVAAYPGMSVPDIVLKVAQRAGLKAGRIDPVAGIGGEPEAQLSQDNVSDWTFLHRLAELVGAQDTVRDGELHLRMPEPPTGAPDPSARASQDPLVLEVNRNLIALRAGVTATAQVPEVGATVAAAWWFTWRAASSAFDPVTVHSLSFTAPSADFLMLVLSPPGTRWGFDTGLIPGVALGAFLAELAGRDLKLEGFNDGSTMRRYIIGGCMMGFGSVLAGGCAVGAGVSGASIFTATAWLVLWSMWIGAVLTDLAIDRPARARAAAIAAIPPVAAQ